MTPKEINAVRTIFKEAPRFAKRNQLFEALVQGKVSSDREAATLLYQKLPTSAFSHLKARLLRQLYEVVLPSLETASLNGSSPAKQLVWQALILGQFYLDRRAPAQAREIAQEGREKAVQAQLTTEILLLENLYLRAQSWLPASECTAANVNILDCAQLLGRQIEARKNYQDLDHALCMDNPKLGSLSPTLSRAIAEIPEMLKEEIPPEIRFWSLMTLTRYLSLVEDLPKALEQGKLLLQTMENHADQFTNFHEDLAQLNWACLNFEAGQTQIAGQVLKAIIAHPKTNHRIWMEAVETHFLIAFDALDIATAAARLEQAMARTKVNTNSFTHAKWTFYAANLAFQQREFHHVLEHLRSCSQLLKSKSKWLPGMKILEIFTLLELEELELAEYRLEALRQLLKRQKNYDIRRARTICKVIGTYIRQGYAPQKVLESCKSMLHLHWRPFNFEVMSLENWLTTLSKKPRLTPSLRKLG